MNNTPTADWVLVADLEKQLKRAKEVNLGLRALIQAQDKNAQNALAEIADLRKDKKRLDWLLTFRGGAWSYWAQNKGEWIPMIHANRLAIDEAMESTE